MKTPSLKSKPDSRAVLVSLKVRTGDRTWTVHGVPGHRSAKYGVTNDLQILVELERRLKRLRRASRVVQYGEIMGDTPPLAASIRRHNPVAPRKRA